MGAPGLSLLLALGAPLFVNLSMSRHSRPATGRGHPLTSSSQESLRPDMRALCTQQSRGHSSRPWPTRSGSSSPDASPGAVLPSGPTGNLGVTCLETPARSGAISCASSFRPCASPRATLPSGRSRYRKGLSLPLMSTASGAACRDTWRSRCSVLARKRELRLSLPKLQKQNSCTHQRHPSLFCRQWTAWRSSPLSGSWNTCFSSCRRIGRFRREILRSNNHDSMTFSSLCVGLANAADKCLDLKRPRR